MAWSFDSYLPVVTARESGGNDDAQNPTSSASGRYQFIDRTYLPLARAAFPGRSDDALMAMKNDPQVQNTVMRSFTDQNVQQLQRAGIEPNNGTVYAAHFLGAPGAVRALSASDDTPISQAVSAGSISANPGVFKNIRTVGDFKRWAGSYGGASTADPTTTGSITASAPGVGIPPSGRTPLGPIGSVLGGTGASAQEAPEPWSASDALIGAGASLMSVYNPSGAAALMAQLKDRKKTAKSSPWELKNYNPETGRAIRVNSETGEFQPYQVTSPYRTMDDTQRNMFNEADDNIGINSSVIANAQKYQQMIADNKIDLSLAARSKDFINSSLDASNEVGRNTQAFLQWRNGLANDLLRLNKGTQTDRDYANTLKELAPGLSNLDNRATLTALDAISTKARDHLGRQIQRQTGVLDEYGDQAPRGDYRETYGSLLPKYEETEKSFAEKRKAYLSRQDDASKADAAAPGPRVAPAREGTSFGDFMRKRLGR